MRKIWRVIVGISTLLFVFQTFVSFKNKEDHSNQIVRKYLLDQLSEMSTFLKDSVQPAFLKASNEAYLQKLFLKTRLDYKKIEWAAEYFTYSTAKMINGAPKPEIDIASQTISNANGLQVIETFLFPHFYSEKKKVLKQELFQLEESISLLQSYFSNIEMEDWQILDAIKLEVFRIESLGLTGYDNALTLHSAEECSTALSSLQRVLLNYVGTNNRLDRHIGQAIAYLKCSKSFEAIDRAYFIRNFANPITTEIEWLRRKFSHKGLHYNRLLRQDVYTLFDSNAFDANAYSPRWDTDKSIEKKILGERLFREVQFSGNKSRSCASCHLPNQAFANNFVKDKSIDSLMLVDRNTPTLINAALQPQQFYDQRSQNMEDQIMDVVHNKKEMNGSFDAVVTYVNTNPDYKYLLKKAYPNIQKIKKEDIVEALSIYVRSLVNLNSRFDAYMNGSNNAMDTSEIQGFNLFMGKAQCGTCHYMPLFNGVFPPKYITQDVEILGVPMHSKSTAIDTDRGIYNVLKEQGLYDSILMKNFDHGFKTTSVRNAALTAPYMHNGAFSSLEELMDFYNQGGGVGRGVNIQNQSLSGDKLNLTPNEVKNIIDFMQALNSR